MSKCETTQSIKDKLEAKRAAEALEGESLVKEIFSNTKETEVRLAEKIKRVRNPYRQTITDEKFNEMYGDESERVKLADKLYTIMIANPNLTEAIKQEIMFDVTRAASKALPIDTFSKDEFGVETIKYDRLSVPVLKKWINKAEEWALSDGKNWNNASFQLTNLEHGLPKNLRFKEPTGAYNIIYNSTQNYADKIATRMSRFLHPEIVHRKETKRNYGMAEVYDEVKTLWQEVDFVNQSLWSENKGLSAAQGIKEGQKWFTELFTMMMHGQAINVNTELANKENAYDTPGIYINTQWAPTGEVYEETKDAIFKWQKPIKLETYNADIHGVEGVNLVFRDTLGRERLDVKTIFDRNIEMSPDMTKKLLNLVEKARVVDKELFTYVKDNMDFSFKKIISALKKHFPQLNNEQVSALFKYNLNVSDLNLTPVDRDNVQNSFDYLESKFTKHSLMEPFLIDSAAFEYKEYHWPAMFSAEYPIMLKETYNELLGQIESLSEVLKDTSGAEKFKTASTIKGLVSSSKRIEQQLANIFSLEDGKVVSNEMSTRKNSKYMKHISNAFDMLKMRKDELVYPDMLDHTMRQITSNELTASLLDALALNPEPGVRNAIESLYKRTLGRKDARGSIFGITLKDEDSSPNSKRMLNIANNLFTFKLAGIDSAITNGFGALQKVLDSGLERFHDAASEFDRLKNNSNFLELIRESAITEFSDFYATALISHMESQELSNDGIYNIVQGTLEYYNNRNKGMSLAKARKQLEKVFKDNYLREIDWNALLTEEEAKSYSKKLKVEKVKRMTSKLVNFAIKREYEMRDVLRKQPGLVAKIKKGGPRILEVLADAMKFFNMSTVEEKLRMTSFILGVQSLQKVGRIKGSIENLTGEDRVLAIQYGRKMTREILDFGMSSNDAGEIYATAWGKVTNKFSIWKTQKMSADKFFFKNAYLAFKDDNTYGSSMKAIWKLSQSMGSKNWDSLWATNPDAARLRSFLYIQGSAVALIDTLFLFGASTSILGGSIAVAAGVIGLRRGHPIGSSFMSLLLAIPLILLKSFSWDDEEDDARELIDYYSRMTPYGLGASIVKDGLFLAMAAVQEDVEYKRDISPIIHSLSPVPYEVSITVQKAVKKTAKLLEDDNTF